jgi:hypothetical protein
MITGVAGQPLIVSAVDETVSPTEHTGIVAPKVLTTMILFADPEYRWVVRQVLGHKWQCG